MNDVELLRDLVRSHYNNAVATPAQDIVNAAIALNRSMRNAPAVAATAIPGLGPPLFPAAGRGGGAGGTDNSTSNNIRMAVNAIYIIIQIVSIIIRILYMYVTYINI